MEKNWRSCSLVIISPGSFRCINHKKKLYLQKVLAFGTRQIKGAMAVLFLFYPEMYLKTKKML